MCARVREIEDQKQEGRDHGTSNIIFSPRDNNREKIMIKNDSDLCSEVPKMAIEFRENMLH